MQKRRFRSLDILYWIAIIMADLFIYIVLGLLMMGYDDSYTESKGPYWSWESMNLQERIIYSATQIWNLVNVIAVVYLIFRAYRYFRSQRTNNGA
jgi:hypothetical protein